MFGGRSENFNFGGVKTRLAMKLARRVYTKASGENTITGIARAIEEEIPLAEMVNYFRAKSAPDNGELDVWAHKICKALDIM